MNLRYRSLYGERYLSTVCRLVSEKEIPCGADQADRNTRKDGMLMKRFPNPIRPAGGYLRCLLAMLAISAANDAWSGGIGYGGGMVYAGMGTVLYPNKRREV